MSKSERKVSVDVCSVALLVKPTQRVRRKAAFKSVQLGHKNSHLRSSSSSPKTKKT